MYVYTFVCILYKLQTYFNCLDHVKSPIFGQKRRVLHQTSSALNFQTIEIGLKVVRFIYIDTYIRILYDQNTVKSPIFWPKTASLTSKLNFQTI